jgi:hypothetical protein
VEVRGQAQYTPGTFLRVPQTIDCQTRLPERATVTHNRERAVGISIARTTNTGNRACCISGTWARRPPTNSSGNPLIYYPQIVVPYYSRYLGTVSAAPATRSAIELLLAGELRQAARALGAIIDGDAGDAEARGALGFIAYRDSQMKQALQLFEKAVELDASATANLVLLAACHLSLEHYDQAIAAFRAALRRDSGLHLAHTLMWSAIAGGGRLNPAIAALKAALGEHWVRTRTDAIATPKVRIENTTLCVVDCNNYLLVERALANCMAGCTFERAMWLTDRPAAIPGVETVTIQPLRSSADYSRFMMKSLLRHIDTEYVLVIQWDGYVANPGAWSPEFLLFDYIGARWNNDLYRKEAHHNVGNGGFSLRSRVLLEALQDPAITLLHPEDRMICREYRRYLEDKHGIVFAQDDIADRFSFEHVEHTELSLGFHGVTNLARFVAAPGWATLDFFFDA